MSGIKKSSAYIAALAVALFMIIGSPRAYGREQAQGDDSVAAARPDSLKIFFTILDATNDRPLKDVSLAVMDSTGMMLADSVGYQLMDGTRYGDFI